MTENTKVEKIAQEMAANYQKKIYTLGSSKKYSIHDIVCDLEEAKSKLNEPEKSQMVDRFHELVGLNCDRKLAHDKLLRDFPG